MTVELRVDEHIVSAWTDVKPEEEEVRGTIFVSLLKSAQHLMELELMKASDEGCDPPSCIDNMPGVPQQPEAEEKPVKETTAPKCPRCKDSPKGCEFYDDGICAGVVFPTDPPQYDPCVYDHGEGA